jgi:TrmH family RNA methyltransferase
MIPHRKRAQSLRTRKGRASSGELLIEGVRLIEDALGADVDVRQLYHLPAEAGSRLDALVTRALSANIPCAKVTADELLSLSDTETPQGIVAIVEQSKWTVDDVFANGTGDVLVLDAVRDPGNVGTLLRTAEAAGARGVLATRGTVEMSNPKVVRGSMGAYFRLPTCVVSETSEIVRLCESVGLPIVATSLQGEDAVGVLAGLDSVALVLGGEAEGINSEWRGAGAIDVRIPMSGSVESLNVAAAGAIVLFRRIWRIPER